MQRYQRGRSRGGGSSRGGSVGYEPRVDWYTGELVRSPERDRSPHRSVREDDSGHVDSRRRVRFQDVQDVHGDRV